MADVIGAPLEQRHADRQAQGIPHGGQILGKQLVLEVFGPRREDHLAPGKQRRDKVGKGLSSTRSGLDHELGVGGDGLGDGPRHLHLLGPRAVAADGLAQGAALGKGRFNGKNQGTV